MKLLKMVYIAHGWFMGYNDKALINQAVEAWQYGPVIRDVYYSFKKYGRGQILSPVDIEKDLIVKDNEIFPEEKNVQLFLDKIWERYSNYSGTELSNLTHQPNTPWAITIKEFGRDAIIPNSIIRNYYKEKIANAAQ